MYILNQQDILQDSLILILVICKDILFIKILQFLVHFLNIIILLNLILCSPIY